MGFALPAWFTPTKASNPCDNMADCIACKFCSHAPIEFERGVRKYEARIAKLIVMWEAAEHKKTIEYHSSEEYRRAHMYDHLDGTSQQAAQQQNLHSVQAAYPFHLY